MSRPLMEGIEKFLGIVPEAKSYFPLKNHTIAHPWMKQQYTYLDLKAAYEEGYLQGGLQEISDFEKWEKDYKFEMLNKKEDDIGQDN